MSSLTRKSVSSVEEVSPYPIEAFQEVTSLLQRSYVTDISEEEAVKLNHAAIRGMLAELHDPYARFMEPEEYKSFVNEYEGYIEGIGATLEMTEALTPLTYRITRVSAKGFEAEYVSDSPLHKQYWPSITALIPGGPAEHAGLKPGDQILEIEGISTFGMNISEAAKLIRGAPGTSVALLIQREAHSKPIEFKIVRRNVYIPTVEQRVLEGDIGYLRITSFNDQTVKLTADALTELESKGIRGLVLDLRDNPGGELDVCLGVAEMFVPEGPIVYIQAKNSEPEPVFASGRARDPGLPLIVLVNQGSLSASEILAGAIQDSGVGKVIGERTFGKGLVQRTRQLTDGSAVRITTARYLTPKKREVNGRGILPDKEVEQPEGVVKPLSDEDLQAKAAIEMLKAEIALRPASPPRHGQRSAGATARKRISSRSRPAGQI
ncbi:MAG: hypothetical protein GTN69_03290 [Armatimonadetes bacterium]|nr:hypothetical protein [Armatimonadota bacterium]NIO74917.1 hypothetical protein [Armatimonadota bacterium]NIO96618.1 hypothetical protein [Armatimonadota bacterium]